MPRQKAGTGVSATRRANLNTSSQLVPAVSKRLLVDVDR